MGVPSLFKTIINKFPRTHYWREDVLSERLYFDFNCLIHHCKAHLDPSVIRNMTTRELDEELISEVIRYTVYITTEVIKPSYLVHIAIDGPVPYAKMIRQRERRYKKIQDDVYTSKLAQKYGMTKEKSFDSNKITPGTSFMSKLCARIKVYIGLGAFSKHIEQSVKGRSNFRVIFSDSSIPGEGEAKIMKHIKDSGPKRSPKSTVIYGLDGDLIILSMLLDRPDVKLLRESEHIAELNEESSFLFLDMDFCKESLIKEYRLESFNAHNIIQDFCALTLLGGNDFVEPLINTRIRERGLQRLINSYTNVLHSGIGHLVKNKTLDLAFLMKVIFYLGKNVDTFVKHRNAESNARPLRDDHKDEYESALSNYFHTSYKNENNPMHQEYIEHFDRINYNKSYDTWSSQYYSHFFPSDTTKGEICDSYWKSVQWTWNYYINSEVPSWSSAYKYRVAPLPKDIIECGCAEATDFEVGKPNSPLEQLMIVLPPQNCSMLPKLISEIIYDDKSLVMDMYPRTIELDVLKGGKNIYSDPILPEVDMSKIHTILRHIPITEYEANRNVIRVQEYSRKF